MGAQKNPLKEEPSLWDGSIKHPQHMFWLRNKKIKFSLNSLNLSPEKMYIFIFLFLKIDIIFANGADPD